MIAVQLQATAGAPVHPVGKREFLPMMAPAALLAGVGGVHRDHVTPGTRSLVRQVRGELAPRRIMNAFGKTVVMDHPVDGQIFHGCRWP